MSRANIILIESVYDQCVWVNLDIVESAFSKIKTFLDSNTPFAQITAWRNTSANHPTDTKRKQYNTQENRQRNIQLISDLRSAGLGGIKVKGVYKEQGAVADEDKEVSFFVPYTGDNVNQFKSTILRLAKKYNQDEIVFSDGKTVSLMKSGGATTRTFRSVAFDVQQLKNAWTQVRGHNYQFLEVASAKGTVFALEAYNNSGLVSDRMGLSLKEYVHRYQSKGGLSE